MQLEVCVGVLAVMDVCLRAHVCVWELSLAAALRKQRGRQTRPDILEYSQTFAHLSQLFRLLLLTFCWGNAATRTCVRV